MLGLSRTKEELNMMTPPPARRPYTYKQYATGPPRRSPRLNGLAVQHKALPLRGLPWRAFRSVRLDWRLLRTVSEMQTHLIIAS